MVYLKTKTDECVGAICETEIKEMLNDFCIIDQKGRICFENTYVVG
jgi:hypothetical protein